MKTIVEEKKVKKIAVGSTDALPPAPSNRNRSLGWQIGFAWARQRVRVDISTPKKNEVEKKWVYRLSVRRSHAHPADDHALTPLRRYPQLSPIFWPPIHFLRSSFSAPRRASSARASAPPIPRRRLRIQLTPSRPLVGQSSAAAAPVHRLLPLPAPGSSRPPSTSVLGGYPKNSDGFP
jgi:hypothetical protein